MNRYTNIKTIGLCHSVQVCSDNLLKELGMQDKLEGRKELIAGIRNIRTQMNVHPSKKSKLILVVKPEYETAIKESEGFLKKLGFSEEIEVKISKDDIHQNAVNVVTSEIEAFMPFEDLVNIEEERQRLEKEKEKILVEKEKTDKMLGNPGFLAKAPAAKVEEEKEKLAKYQEMLKASKERLETIK